LLILILYHALGQSQIILVTFPQIPVVTVVGVQAWLRPPDPDN
jgi:hypothetical protein